MTETQHFDAATEEQASLYVLELLSPEERLRFDRRLAQDAGLRGLVRELQGNLDAEVFAEPAPAAPLTVWGRIAAQTRTEPVPLLAFPRPVTVWTRRVLAAAACVAVGAGIHAWWSGRPQPAVAQQPGSVAVPEQASPPTALRPVPGPTPGVSRSPAGPNVAVPPEAVPVVPGGAVRDPEKVRLEQRVRILSAQVAQLNQVLTQQFAVPSGITRLHVFQLGPPGTNQVDSASDGERSRKLAETLAQLAADQMARALPPPGSLGTANEDTSGEPQVPTDPIVPKEQPLAPPVAVVPVIPAVPTATGTAAAVSFTASLPTTAPIGFLNPDTGQGALAIESALVGQYQLWQADHAGNLTSLGVVPTSDTLFSVVTFSTHSGTGFDAPFISLEPAGGSLQPTGPIIGNFGATNAPAHP